MARIAKNSLVRQVMPAPIEGQVVSFNVDQESGALMYLVQWFDADGNQQARYFAEGEIEVVG